MKRISWLFISFIILNLSLLIHGQEPSWHIKLKRVKPFESSKEDVEKIFDDARVTKVFVDKGAEFVFYDTPDGELSLIYSIGKCSFDKEARFDVDKGKVIEAIFFPKNRGEIKLSKFRIKKDDFYKVKEDDNPTLHYINDEMGIDYATQRGKVLGVKLIPSSKFDNLKCENLKNNE